MSNQATAHDYELAPVKFSRLTRRGVLLGLSGSQLVVVGVRRDRPGVRALLRRRTSP